MGARGVEAGPVAKEVGRLVAAARREAGIRQVELALRLGVCQATVSHLENGRRAVTVDDLRRLALILNVPASTLAPHLRAVW